MKNGKGLGYKDLKELPGRSCGEADIIAVVAPKSEEFESLH